MQTLTKAEEQVMVALWELEKGFVKDILTLFPEPKPAYNTVSTIVRILETKGFVGHEEMGKSHRYLPLISKKEYSSFSLNEIKERYFSGSPSSLLSFFAKEEKIDIAELEQLLNELKRKEGGTHGA
jgi:BlaI family transcriptional regulator, penicillinase repressor